VEPHEAKVSQIKGVWKKCQEKKEESEKHTSCFLQAGEQEKREILRKHTDCIPSQFSQSESDRSHQAAVVLCRKLSRPS